MTLEAFLKMVDRDAVVVITDGINDTMRCIAADVSRKFLRRSVDFVAASDFGGLHLRIVVSAENIFELH